MVHPLSHSVKWGICSLPLMFWALSPMYDVNPDIVGEYLSLNVDTDNSKINLNLAIEASNIMGSAGVKQKE